MQLADFALNCSPSFDNALAFLLATQQSAVISAEGWEEARALTNDSRDGGWPKQPRTNQRRLRPPLPPIATHRLQGLPNQSRC